MIDQRIPLHQIAASLAPGVIDALTVIPEDEIADKGIRFVRSMIDETGAKMKWDVFWRYFRTTWMKSYGSDLWNVDSMIKAGVDVQNRTNNPLERYNRAFSELFAEKHPSLLSFVETTKTPENMSNSSTTLSNIAVNHHAMQQL